MGIKVPGFPFRPVDSAPAGVLAWAPFWGEGRARIAQVVPICSGSWEPLLLGTGAVSIASVDIVQTSREAAVTGCVCGGFLIQNSPSQALHATLFHERTSSNTLMADNLSLTGVVHLANNLCPDSQMLGIVNGDAHTADIDCLIHKSSVLKCVYSNVMGVGDFCHFHRQWWRDWALELDLPGFECQPLPQPC